MVWMLFGLILLNALLAMSEMALVSAKPARLQKWIDAGDRGAIAAAKLAEDPAGFLSTIQVGITSIAILSGIFGEAALAQPLGDYFQQSLGLAQQTAEPLATGIVVVCITYLSIVVGELAPKRLGQLNPEKVSRIVARPIALLSRLTHPAVIFLSRSTALVLRAIGVRNTTLQSVTPEEFHAILEEGTESGLIDAQEHKMLRNVFRLEDRKTSSLMVPRLDITWLSLNDPLPLTLQKINNSRHSRFPVCYEQINDMVGVVSAKAVLKHALDPNFTDLKSLLIEPLYVPDSLNGIELLNTLRESKTKMAFVVDEYGDLQGMVTSQDLLEAITGEFLTAQDEEAQAIQRQDGSWLLDGMISNEELKDRLGLKQLPEEKRRAYQTLSGMMTLLLGRIPQTTDQIEWADWRFEIVDMDGQRIDKVLATRLPDTDQ